MKGVSPIVAQVLIVALVMSMIVSFSYFITSTQKEMQKASYKEREVRICSSEGKLRILKVKSKEIKIKNEGPCPISVKSILVYEKLSNKTKLIPFFIKENKKYISPGDSFTLFLQENISENAEYLIVRSDFGFDYYPLNS